MRYNPDDIKLWGNELYSFQHEGDLKSLFPLEGALGNRSWELVAAHIVSLSQKKGEWVGVKDFHPDYDTKGMIKAGLLKGVYKKIEWPDSLEAKKIGVMLTEEAIERLVQYTDPAQSAYMGKCCDSIMKMEIMETASK